MVELQRMRYFVAFTLLGLYVVFLSTLEPDTGRWFAIGMLGVIALTPAVGQFNPGRRRGKPRGERGY